MKKILKLLLAFLIISSILPNAYAEDEKVNWSHLMLFEEGTPNISSPHVWKKGLLYGMFSHLWFKQDFPKGSNPVGYVSYTPIDNFQLDGLLTIRNNYELEFGVKYQILNQYKGDFLSLSPRISYNSRGNVFSSEISLDKVLFEDRLMLGASYSFLSSSSLDGITSYYQTIGLNSIARVYGHWYLFGDVVLPLDNKLFAERGFIWSAGIKDQMMGTPHNFSIFIGNSNVSTITGRSISVSNVYPDVIKLGFDFSIIIEDVTKLPKLMFFDKNSINQDN